MKDKESNPDLESNLENTDGRLIIDADTTPIVTTTTIQPEEPIYMEEGKPKEPHLSRGRQKVGIVDNTTPTTIQHRVGSPGMR